MLIFVSVCSVRTSIIVSSLHRVTVTLVSCLLKLVVELNMVASSSGSNEVRKGRR